MCTHWDPKTGTKNNLKQNSASLVLGYLLSFTGASQRSIIRQSQRWRARVDYHFQLPYSQKLIQVTSRHTQEPKLNVYLKKNVHNVDICSLYEGQKGHMGRSPKETLHACCSKWPSRIKNRFKIQWVAEIKSHCILNQWHFS